MVFTQSQCIRKLDIPSNCLYTFYYWCWNFVGFYFTYKILDSSGIVVAHNEYIDLISATIFQRCCGATTTHITLIIWKHFLQSACVWSIFCLFWYSSFFWFAWNPYFTERSTLMPSQTCSLYYCYRNHFSCTFSVYVSPGATERSMCKPATPLCSYQNCRPSMRRGWAVYGHAKTTAAVMAWMWFDMSMK